MTLERPEGAARGALRFSEALRFAAVSVLFSLLSLLLCLPLFPLLGLKAAVPSVRWRTALTGSMRWLARGWIAGAVKILSFLPTRWDVEAPRGLDRRSWHLILSNHQSWVDILVLVRVFGNRIPFPVFFPKKELLRFPLLGQAMWGLDYPFIERYSRELLERRPELRGRDRETVRVACERARRLPTTLIVFPEGTRYTPGKHSRQGSPFRHLLRPRPAGTAIVLATLGDRLGEVLDITVVYPSGRPEFREFLAGRVGRVIVRACPLHVPPRLAAEGVESPESRRRFQEWIDGLWREKDALIARLLSSGEDWQDH